jgi:hypothetical protein
MRKQPKPLPCKLNHTAPNPIATARKKARPCPTC